MCIYIYMHHRNGVHQRAGISAEVLAAASGLSGADSSHQKPLIYPLINKHSY